MESSMNQLGGLAGCPAGEIGLLDEECTPATARCFAKNAGTGNSATYDQKIPVLYGKFGNRGLIASQFGRHVQRLPPGVSTYIWIGSRDLDDDVRANNSSFTTSARRSRSLFLTSGEIGR